jgi:hypothetical protein
MAEASFIYFTKAEGTNWHDLGEVVRGVLEAISVMPPLPAPLPYVSWGRRQRKQFYKAYKAALFRLLPSSMGDGLPPYVNVQFATWGQPFGGEPVPSFLIHTYLKHVDGTWRSYSFHMVPGSPQDIDDVQGRITVGLVLHA